MRLKERVTRLETRATLSHPRFVFYDDLTAEERAACDAGAYDRPGIRVVRRVIVDPDGTETPLWKLKEAQS